MTEQVAEQRSERTAEKSVAHRAVAVLTKVEKTYHLDQIDVPVIKGVDILVRQACFTVLLAPLAVAKRRSSI